MRRMMLGLALAAATATVAAEGSVQTVQGRVLSATPVVRIVQISEPREVCREEVVRYQQRSTTTPTIIGAIIGGAVGNQFGGGNGRRALTVAGAALGGSIANDRAQRAGAGGQVRTYCEVVDDYREEEQITGYRVEYEYAGEVYTTRTRRDPGRFIDLRVSVTPVGA